MDLSALTWRKSSYSSGGGDNCVEVAAVPDAVGWRKNSFSPGGGNACVEVGAHRSSVAVRDSKDPAGQALLLDLGAFCCLTTRIKHGEYDQ